MPMRQPMVFDRERCALFSMLVEQACEAAIRQGLFLQQDEHKARMILGGRLIGALEAGETDIEKLQAIALRPDNRCNDIESLVAPAGSARWDITNPTPFASSQT
jgi:hypothetical protein